MPEIVLKLLSWKKSGKIIEWPWYIFFHFKRNFDKFKKCLDFCLIGGGVEDTRLEAKAKDTKKSEAKDSPSEDRHFRGQGQKRSRPRPRKQTQDVLSKKKFFKNFFRRSPTTKKSSKLFSPDLQKNGLEKNFSAHLQNFNHSKDSAVLEPRTGQFSRTWGFEAKDFKMCPRGQGRPRGLHLCLLYWTRRWE